METVGAQWPHAWLNHRPPDNLLVARHLMHPTREQSLTPAAAAQCLPARWSHTSQFLAFRTEPSGRAPEYWRQGNTVPIFLPAGEPQSVSADAGRERETAARVALS
ncbi:MAG: hypothetical protein M3Q03_17230 [Chloroflexota bacterium]|nr:hypothetical protein [Chloroflexota bacterium]